MESATTEIRLANIVFIILSRLRKLSGVPPRSDPPLGPPQRAPYAQMRIEISSICIEINNEICTMLAPRTPGHISIIVDPESVPQTLITSDAALASDATSAWPTPDPERFQLDVRPSSRLLFTLHEGRSSKSNQRSFIVPVAALFSGNQPDGSSIYKAYNKGGKLLLRLTLSLVLKSYPQYSQPTFKEPLNGSPSDSAPEESSYRLFHLIREKRRFSDVFSWEVGSTLCRLIVFLHQNDQKIPKLPTTFIWSTMSVFWRITQDLGLPQSQSTSSDTLPANSAQLPATLDHWSGHQEEVPSGDEYPLRNIIFQMNYLLGIRIPAGRLGKDDLVLAILRELCVCVAVLEAYIESYREITWMKACLANQARMFAERQRELFLLGCKCALLTHEPERYNGLLGDGKQVIEEILKLAVEEGLDREETDQGKPESKESREKRRFTAVILSARDSQCDNVWDITFEILEKEKNKKKRDMYRHILTKLVQAADKTPSSLWVGRGDLIKRNTQISQTPFASVYKSRLNDQDIVVKCLHTLSKTLTSIHDRRKVYLEIVPWKTLKHDNLLPFMGVCREKLRGEETLTVWCMVSPYMKKGTLRSCYAAATSNVDEVSSNQTGPEFDLSVRMRHIHQVASGMAYLHDEGVVHGDLRGDNIFLDSSDNVQIADFGLCLFLTGFSDNYYSMRTGNIRWTAPELVAPQKYPLGRALPVDSNTVPPKSHDDAILTIARPTMKSDAFSFSCVCIEVFSGHPPFEGSPTLDESALRNRVWDGKLTMPPQPACMELDLWKIVKDCRSNFANERPIFKTILEDVSKCAGIEKPNCPDGDHRGESGQSNIRLSG